MIPAAIGTAAACAIGAVVAFFFVAPDHALNPVQTWGETSEREGDYG